MALTRDIRSLKDYIKHFKKYGRLVINSSGVSDDTIGIIEDIDGDLYFRPVKYHGVSIKDFQIRFLRRE